MSEFGPSFYGEVLAIPSRAVDDEEDEEDLESAISSSSVLRWSADVCSSLEDSGYIECNVLIIAIDSIATAFIKTHFLHMEHERIGVICSGLTDKSVGTLDQDAFTDETCYIYRLKNEPSVLFCQCNTAVPSEQAYSWVDQLFLGIRNIHTYVAVLSHRPVAEYRCEQPSSSLKVPFLKALKTTHYNGTPLCKYLEQPNVIDGLPAQVMTHCQVKAIPAVYYICYTENLYMDMPSVTEFTRLTTVTPFKDFYKANPDAINQMKSLIDQNNRLNTMYM